MEMDSAAAAAAAAVPSYPMIIFDVSTAGIRKWSLTFALPEGNEHNACVSRMDRKISRRIWRMRNMAPTSGTIHCTLH